MAGGSRVPRKQVSWVTYLWLGVSVLLFAACFALIPFTFGVSAFLLPVIPLLIAQELIDIQCPLDQ